MTLSAAQVAEAVGGPTVAFTPPTGKLSTQFDWFGDADRLCVIARGPAMKHQGRQVLTLRVGSSGVVHLVAGVNYSKPPPGHEPVLMVSGSYNSTN